MLMPLAVAGALTLPALSVHVPEADCPAPSLLSVTSGSQFAIPDSPSEPPKLTVTSVLFHPLALGPGDALAPAVGGVLSILIPDWVSEAVLPALSSHVPVAVRLAPSVFTVWLTVAATTPERLYVQFQLTVTFVLFHPLAWPLGSDYQKQSAEPSCRS